MSQDSICLMTKPVSGDRTCVVPPAAASRGRQGSIRIEENLHLVTISLSVSVNSVMSSLMSLRRLPRLETLFLKRLTPEKEAKGSAKMQSGS